MMYDKASIWTQASLTAKVFHYPLTVVPHDWSLKQILLSYTENNSGVHIPEHLYTHDSQIHLKNCVSWMSSGPYCQIPRYISIFMTLRLLPACPLKTLLWLL